MEEVSHDNQRLQSKLAQILPEYAMLRDFKRVNESAQEELMEKQRIIDALQNIQDEFHQREASLKR